MNDLFVGEKLSLPILMLLKLLTDEEGCS